MNILITGVSRGLGYHISCKFLAEGYNVIGISRSSLDEVAPLSIFFGAVCLTFNSLLFKCFLIDLSLNNVTR